MIHLLRNAIARTVRRALGIVSPSVECAKACGEFGERFAAGLADPRPLTAEEWAEFLETCHRINQFNFGLYDETDLDDDPPNS